MKGPTIERMITILYTSIYGHVFKVLDEEGVSDMGMGNLKDINQDGFHEAYYAVDVIFQKFRPSGFIEEGEEFFTGKHML